MPRPIKGRKVGFVPEVTFFKPAGIRMHSLEVISISIEELESIRLKDKEGLQQEECAQIMGISRPTFHRVLRSARRKIAQALTTGLAIRIEGGNFETAQRRFRCGRDGHEWEVPFDKSLDENTRICPRCDTPNARVIPAHVHGFKGRGRGRGRGRSC